MNLSKNVRCAVLVLAGIGLNLLMSAVVATFNIPLYLDSIGTVLVAALSGYIPGIVVGLVTNIIKCFDDPTSIYYASLNVLIAVVAAWAARRKWFRKVWGLPLIVIALTFIGGVLGSILTWFLYGYAEVGITTLATEYIYSKGIFSQFSSQLIADTAADFLDKVITVAIAALVINILPRDLRRSFRIYGWQQTPLNTTEKIKVGDKIHTRHSLRMKIMVILSVAMVVIAVAAITIGYINYQSSLISTHEALAQGVTDYVGSILDPDEIDNYMEQGTSHPDYGHIVKLMEATKSSSPVIEYVYVYKIEDDGCHVVFDLESLTDPEIVPGMVVPFDESFSKFIPDLLEGKEIEPLITNDTYGWLLTIYKPVYNDAGKCVCYACTDISMHALVVDGYGYLAKQISLFTGVFILILSIALWLAHYNSVLPVNTMAVSAGEFAYDSETTMDESVERLKELDIHTGDEIENLYHSFVKTSEDSVHYVTQIKDKQDQISKLQNGLILVLADMVESRDQYTGDHVRKTAVYCNVLMHELLKLGYYKDQLTPEYIEDVTNAAPLHDIGKIKIPDAILNKKGPERLTDEEFEIMKTHAMAGSEIIQQTMKTVPESGYLDEARNLAEFHHEKWNGKGYPHGLSGEEIPLSARVMALADVFDALVSKRSYKDPFPFEKAAQIIEEGSGTHFDPKVVEAFVNTKEAFQKISEHFSDVDGIDIKGLIH